MDQDRDQLRLERQHLERTIENARHQMEDIRQHIGEREAALRASQEDLWDDSTHSVTGLYSMQGFHDLVELSQLTQPMAGDIEAHETEARTLRALERMLDAPYFARVDFLFNGESGAERIYIGRATLMDENGLDIAVYDWRAPVASLFYRHGLGAASYRAPCGTVSGTLLLKRQYEIQGGALAYFFDADVRIVDAFLRELLSKSASPAMKAIVETIQKDQDVIIRDMDSEVLMVQGAAGSGKTSVALHRVAYLMYRELAGRLAADELLILSPNAVFERYVAHVLPELGERSVRTLLLDEVLRILLPRERVQPRFLALEERLGCADAGYSRLLRSTASFKGSAAFLEILDRLAADLPGRWVDFRDVDYGGRCVAPRQASKAAVCNGKKTAPVGARLKWLERAILERARALRKDRIAKLEGFAALHCEQTPDVIPTARMLSLWETTALSRQIRAFTEIDCRALYRRLFAEPPAFRRLAKGLDLPPDIEEILRFTREELAEDVLRFEDAAAIAYLQAKVHGCAEFRHVRQVVLDEAQDEPPLHFALLRELFPRARYTILGDIHQAVGRRADGAMYDQVERILGKKKTERVTMSKSFRFTEEIWRFSARFLPRGEAGECFSRTGERPGVRMAADAAELEELLVCEVAECRARGYQSVALICKTEREAAALCERLRPRVEAALVRGDGETDARGVFAIPVYMAKGLEFDAVLVCDADAGHYADEEDKSLLYVACTRALHRLNLFGVGRASPLLCEPGEEERA